MATGGRLAGDRRLRAYVATTYPSVSREPCRRFANQFAGGLYIALPGCLRLQAVVVGELKVVEVYSLPCGPRSRKNLVRDLFADTYQPMGNTIVGPWLPGLVGLRELSVRDGHWTNVSSASSTESAPSSVAPCPRHREHPDIWTFSPKALSLKCSAWVGSAAFPYESQAL